MQISSNSAIPNPEEYTKQYAKQNGKSVDDAKNTLKTEIDNVSSAENQSPSPMIGNTTSIFMQSKADKNNSMDISYPLTMDFSSEMLPPEPIDGRQNFSWFNILPQNKQKNNEEVPQKGFDIWC